MFCPFVKNECLKKDCALFITKLSVPDESGKILSISNICSVRSAGIEALSKYLVYQPVNKKPAFVDG